MAPHGYFNLAGSAEAGDVGSHNLRLSASRYTPVDETLIPTGEIADVDGSAYDFREPRPFPGDIDLNFVVNGSPGDLRDIATVSHGASGRHLGIRATAPGVQIYGGANMGKGGRFPANAGFCIEPQYFPDAPNQPGFAVPRIDEDNAYREVVEYTLG
jgi:aldose 1-epimerase